MKEKYSLIISAEANFDIMDAFFWYESKRVNLSNNFGLAGINIGNKYLPQNYGYIIKELE